MRLYTSDRRIIICPSISVVPWSPLCHRITSTKTSHIQSSLRRAIYPRKTQGSSIRGDVTVWLFTKIDQWLPIAPMQLCHDVILWPPTVDINFPPHLLQWFLESLVFQLLDCISYFFSNLILKMSPKEPQSAVPAHSKGSWTSFLKVGCMPPLFSSSWN